MKKILLLSLLLAPLSFFGQITNEGQPASWEFNIKSKVAPIVLPSIQIEQIKSEDLENDKFQAKPYRIGISQKVNHGLSNAGAWSQLPNGDRIWRVLFSSKDAVHLSVNFDQFFLPKGAHIYLYNDSQTDLVGAYTELENNINNMLGSWIVAGDKLWVEYYEPRAAKGQGKLNISNVIHGYRLGHNYQKGYHGHQEKDLNDSGDCNQDVDCPIGVDFAANRDILKKAVAFLNMGDGFVCSGTLINNTAEDKKPYFLTANHCFNRSGGGSANPALFTARFNWISPNPSCATILESTQGPTNFVMSGSNERARNAESDVALIEFQGAIPTNWDVSFAGWDKSDVAPSFVVGIHHPMGDIMKICRDDTGVIKGSHGTTNSPTAQTWDITTIGGGWELGVTEGGSSGSALFDNDGRIIGQLFGGAASCIGTVDNGQIDFYGRFAISWDFGTTAATRLKDWLDPLDLDPVTLNTKENVLAVNDEFLDANISVFPNPSRGFVQIRTTGLVGDLKYEVYNVLGRILKTNKLENNEIIHFDNLPDDIYFMKITETDSNKVLVKKIVLSR